MNKIRQEIDRIVNQHFVGGYGKLAADIAAALAPMVAAPSLRVDAEAAAKILTEIKECAEAIVRNMREDIALELRDDTWVSTAACHAVVILQDLETLRHLTASAQPTHAPVPLPGWVDPVEAAILFHDTYERLAPSFGYETRKDTKKFDTTTPNGKLMIAVCGEVIRSAQPKAETAGEPSDAEMLEYVIKHSYRPTHTVDLICFQIGADEYEDLRSAIRAAMQSDKGGSHE